jgi:comEA protein
MKKAIMVLVALATLGVSVVSAPAFAEEAASNKAANSSELRVNLNTATAEELTELPGIGEKVAARIVAYRKSNGDFQKVEEVMNVKGIGEKTFTKLRGHLSVEKTSRSRTK